MDKSSKITYPEAFPSFYSQCLIIERAALLALPMVAAASSNPILAP